MIEICKRCNKNFRISPCRKGLAKFCSIICRNESYKGKAAKWILLDNNKEICRKISKSKMGNKSRLGLHHTLNTKLKIGLANTKEEVTYSGIHAHIRRLKGKPTCCVFCGITGVRISWANIDYSYTRNPDEYIALCASCHYKFDQIKPEWGTATQKQNYG